MTTLFGSIMTIWIVSAFPIAIWFFFNGFSIGPRRFALAILALILWPIVIVGTFAGALITDRNIWAEWRKKA